MKTRDPLHPVNCRCFACRPLLPGERASAAQMATVWWLVALCAVLTLIFPVRHVILPLLIAVGVIQP